MEGLNIGQNERKTQNRIIALFTDQLKYAYLGNWKDRQRNSNIDGIEVNGYLASRGYR